MLVGFETDENDKTDHHFWLTRSVARVAGVNLNHAIANGSLRVSDYHEMIAECQVRGCRAACETWLAQQTDWPASPPPYCAHARILAELRQMQRPH
ncbi:DUF6455 family protein [Antarcticimicrobium sediminis]|uniref:DUF6455 domain-containing protein n=1 Tax=Antarcticimicrobium sediminis TaxID=2546227 RepID=A0A4R5EPY1_9RHOB|nr:DUF6455 family protein [Antarcticimicrobium sediminis]TDE36692.1 hypothetical protein E1B25_14355 [Antarcticimicrobium sediminis]